MKIVHVSEPKNLYARFILDRNFVERYSQEQLDNLDFEIIEPLEDIKIQFIILILEGTNLRKIHLPFQSTDVGDIIMLKSHNDLSVENGF